MRNKVLSAFFVTIIMFFSINTYGTTHKEDYPELIKIRSKKVSGSLDDAKDTQENEKNIEQDIEKKETVSGLNELGGFDGSSSKTKKNRFIRME